MSTFYKYVERNVADRVDWSTINKNFSGMLKEEATLREKKKADIEKATEETLQTLADNPTGLDRGVNENILNYSTQGQEYLLMMNRLLKSGQLDPKDFSIYTQNLKTDTSKIFQTTKTYQENYAKDVERAKTGTSSEQEVYLRSLVENAANFSKSQFYINNNGRVTVGLPQIDPATGQYVLNKDPNTYNTIDTLKYASTVQLDKYDVDKEVANVVDSFGKEIFASAALEGRVIRTIEDIRTRTGYEVYEQRYIDSLLVNPNSSASILTDWIKSKTNKEGKVSVYGFTNNPNDPQIKTGEKILMIADPANPTSGVLTPQLSPEQKKDAENFLRDRIRAGLDYEAKTQYYEPPQAQEWQARRGDEKKEKETAVGTWGRIFTAGTAQEKKDAVAAIVGTKLAQEKGLLDIDFNTPGKITFLYDNNKMNRTIDYDPNTITLKRWNELGNEIHGVDDVLSVMKRTGGGNPNMRLSGGQKSFTGVKGGREKVKSNSELLGGYLGTVSGLSTQDNPTETVNKLTTRFGDLGFTFTPEKNTLSPDRVKITTPDGKRFQWFVLKGNIDNSIKKFIASAAEDDNLVVSNIPVVETKKPNLADQMKANKKN
jgi:hypothetical protein